MFPVKHFLVLPSQRKKKGSIFPLHFVLLRPLTVRKLSLWKGMFFLKKGLNTQKKTNPREQTRADYQLTLVLQEVKHSVRNSKICQNSTFRSRIKHFFFFKFFKLSKPLRTWRSQRNGQIHSLRYGRWVFIWTVFSLWVNGELHGKKSRLDITEKSVNLSIEIMDQVHRQNSAE